MDLNITPRFNMEQVRRQLAEQVSRIKQSALFTLRMAGEKFVGEARNNSTYSDQTGNLRSSIGYVILDNGVQVDENFEGDQQEGKETARRVAAEIAATYPTGLTLICVAGMDYAAAVEAKGFDVITFSAAVVVDWLQESMASLKDQIEQAE